MMSDPLVVLGLMCIGLMFIGQLILGAFNRVDLAPEWDRETLKRSDPESEES